MTARPIRLYGAKISMFTGKVRSYLIKNHIPFEELAASNPHFVANIVPKIGRPIIPVIEMPGGTIVQDTTDIIDYLEGHITPRISAYPQEPLTHLLALILELFGDMGLTRPAMHYRWNFPDTTHTFITHGFGSAAGPDASDAQRAGTDAAIKKFSGFLPMLGVTDDTIPEIERSYIELLHILDNHFARHPYFLGPRPTMADYGMMCSLYAHLGRDPVPAGLMKNHAPSLYRWTERMNTPHDDISDMPYYRASQTLPETLGPILNYIRQYFIPQMRAATETLNALPIPESGARASLHPKFFVLGTCTFDHGNTPITCAVQPMLFYMAQRVSDFYAGLNADDKIKARDYLAPFGLDTLLTQTAKYRVSRKDHLEVWE